MSALKALAGTSGKEAPPVDQWNPVHCEEAGFEILRDGCWKHEGTRITRETLVRLFASILRKDAYGQTYLVTPGEKIRVPVKMRRSLRSAPTGMGQAGIRRSCLPRMSGMSWRRDQTIRCAWPMTGQARVLMCMCAGGSRRAFCGRLSMNWRIGLRGVTESSAFGRAVLGSN